MSTWLVKCRVLNWFNDSKYLRQTFKIHVKSLSVFKSPVLQCFIIIIHWTAMVTLEHMRLLLQEWATDQVSLRRQRKQWQSHLDKVMTVLAAQPGMMYDKSLETVRIEVSHPPPNRLQLRVLLTETNIKPSFVICIAYKLSTHQLLKTDSVLAF